MDVVTLEKKCVDVVFCGCIVKLLVKSSCVCVCVCVRGWEVSLVLYPSTAEDSVSQFVRLTLSLTLDEQVSLMDESRRPKD